MRTSRRMTRPSARVVRLPDSRRKPKSIYFNRAELNALLSLYSRQVARGEWRDYAIDHREGVALFSFFRHTHESPAFTLAKRLSGRGPAEYTLFSGRQRLNSGSDLAEVLAVFRRRPFLVPNAS